MADVTQIFVDVSMETCELGDPINQCSRAPVLTVGTSFFLQINSLAILDI